MDRSLGCPRGLALCAVLLGTLLGLIACGSDHSHAPTAQRLQDAVARPGSAAYAYAAFRRSPRFVDAPPGWGVQSASHMSRLIDSGSASGIQAWGEINAGQVCVSLGARGSHREGATSGGGCNSASRLGGEPIIAGVRAPLSHGNSAVPSLLAGLVPDGVRSVVINYADGRSQSVRVRNNGFALRITYRPIGFLWIDRHGRSHPVQ